MHASHATYDVVGRKVTAIDYHADSWACLRGKSGGRYLVVVMSRTAGANCSECEYSRLYDLNGRLIASDLVFDARGHARPSKAGQEMMQEILGGPGPFPFSTCIASRTSFDRERNFLSGGAVGALLPAGVFFRGGCGCVFCLLRGRLWGGMVAGGAGGGVGARF